MTSTRDISFYLTAINAILRLAEQNATDDAVYLKGRLYDIEILANSMRVALLSAAENRKDMTLEELRLLFDTLTPEDKRNMRTMLT